MGKGDIRTRRGKIWRGTYGVTRPRRYKTVVRPAAATRKVKTLKDLSNVVAESAVNPAEAAHDEVAAVAGAEASAKKPAAKKAPAAKKPVAKKATEKKD